MSFLKTNRHPITETILVKHCLNNCKSIYCEQKNRSAIIAAKYKNNANGKPKRKQIRANRLFAFFVSVLRLS